MTQQAVAEEAKPDEIPVQAAEATQAGAMEKDVLRIVRANIDKTEESPDNDQDEPDGTDTTRPADS